MINIVTVEGSLNKVCMYACMYPYGHPVVN